MGARTPLGIPAAMFPWWVPTRHTSCPPPPLDAGRAPGPGCASGEAPGRTKCRVLQLHRQGRTHSVRELGPWELCTRAGFLHLPSSTARLNLLSFLLLVWASVSPPVKRGNAHRWCPSGTAVKMDDLTVPSAGAEPARTGRPGNVGAPPHEDSLLIPGTSGGNSLSPSLLERSQTKVLGLCTRFAADGAFQ